MSRPISASTASRCGWFRQAEADGGQRNDRLTTDERKRLDALERSRKANGILSGEAQLRWRIASHMRKDADLKSS